MRNKDAHPARTAWLVVGGPAAFMLVLAGCGSSNNNNSGGGSSNELQKLGKGEGQVNLISWAGYVEPEWTKPFEQETGCKVNDKVAGTSDEMVDLMGTGQYDGVSASGNATGAPRRRRRGRPRQRRASSPTTRRSSRDLKNQPYNTFEGVHYGIPHGRGANLLMWNSKVVKPAPAQLERDARPEGGRQVQGQDQPVYDDPMSDRRSGGST